MMPTMSRKLARSVWTLAVAAFLGSLIEAGAASAPVEGIANEIAARIDLGSEARASLRIELNGKPVEIERGAIGLLISDPRRRNQILKILLDPAFDPPSADAAGVEHSAFWVETSILPAGLEDEVSELASCDWTDATRTTAACTVEDGGGGFLIRIGKRNPDLRGTEIWIVVGDGLTTGFRVASSTGTDGETDSYTVRSATGSPVVLPAVIE